MTKKALIVVDMQNDFVSGSLAVRRGSWAVGRAFVDILFAKEDDLYDAYAFTQDWHIDPGTHWESEGRPADYVDTWPRHCEADTHGADFAEPLKGLVEAATEHQPDRFAVFRKGQHKAAYSGFEGVNEDGASLEEWLAEREITAVEIMGIALDYCVKATALDAAEALFDTSIRVDRTVPVHQVDGSVKEVIFELAQAGVSLTNKAGEGFLWKGFDNFV